MGLQADAVMIRWARSGFQGTPRRLQAHGQEGAPVAQALSPEAALAEVESCTSMDLDVDEITGLRDILAMKRDDTAIHRHLKKHGHPLGELPSETKWWVKVHDDMTEQGLYQDPPPGPPEHRAPRQRGAVIAWLNLRILPALAGEPPGSAASTSTTGPGAHHPPTGMGPGHDLIAGRRTAKRHYAEKLAGKWAASTFPGAEVEMVGDHVPKLHYDVEVRLDDGKQVHIEAKATSDYIGARVELTEDERQHVQDSGCMHEHVLFVVSGVRADQVEGGKWYCWGGVPRHVRGWKIADPELELQPRWVYTVPSTTQAQVEVCPPPAGHGEPGPAPSEGE